MSGLSTITGKSQENPTWIDADTPIEDDEEEEPDDGMYVAYI